MFVIFSFKKIFFVLKIIKKNIISFENFSKVTVVNIFLKCSKKENAVCKSVNVI